MRKQLSIRPSSNRQTLHEKTYEQRVWRAARIKAGEEPYTPTVAELAVIFSVSAGSIRARLALIDAMAGRTASAPVIHL